MKGFIEFIRKQGVVGLAIGFILGGSISKVVSALVSDLVNPLLGIVLGSAQNLAEVKVSVGGAEILWGHLVAAVIDFAIIALVVYFGVKASGLEKLDKKD